MRAFIILIIGVVAATFLYRYWYVRNRLAENDRFSRELVDKDDRMMEEMYEAQMRIGGMEQDARTKGYTPELKRLISVEREKYHAMVRAFNSQYGTDARKPPYDVVELLAVPTRYYQYYAFVMIQLVIVFAATTHSKIRKGGRLYQFTLLEMFAGAAGIQFIVAAFFMAK